MRNKLLFVFMFSILLISTTCASEQQLGTFKKNTNITLHQICADCTYNNISSVLYPNSTISLSNVKMNQDGTYFSYTFKNTTTLGTYIVNGYGDLGGVKTTWVYSFEVTASGGKLEQGSAGILIVAILFMLLIGGVLLMGFLRTDQNMQTKWTLFILSFLFFLIGVNLISILIGDTSANPQLISFFDSFMSIMFIIFWFAFGLLAIMWFLTMFQTILFKNKQNKQLKYG